MSFPCVLPTWACRGSGYAPLGSGSAGTTCGVPAEDEDHPEDPDWLAVGDYASLVSPSDPVKGDDLKGGGASGGAGGSGAHSKAAVEGLGKLKLGAVVGAAGDTLPVPLALGVVQAGPRGTALSGGDSRGLESESPSSAASAHVRAAERPTDRPDPMGLGRAGGGSVDSEETGGEPECTGTPQAIHGASGLGEVVVSWDCWRAVLRQPVVTEQEGAEPSCEGRDGPWCAAQPRGSGSQGCPTVHAVLTDPRVARAVVMVKSRRECRGSCGDDAAAALGPVAVHVVNVWGDAFLVQRHCSLSCCRGVTSQPTPASSGHRWGLQLS